MKRTVVALLIFINILVINAKPPRPNNSTVKSRPKSFQPFSSRRRFNDFPWDTFCTDNNVPDETFFPHPENCQWFYMCVNDVLQAGSCHDGEYFNPTESVCIPSNEYECVLGLFPEWGANGCPPAGNTDLVLIASNFCDSFYVCINGIPVEMPCRPGQHWNAERLYCDDPRNAGCDEESRNLPQILPDCPVGYLGNLPHPDNCDMFVHCANGNRFIQRCPHLYSFDVVTTKCIVATQASCIDEFRGRSRN